MDLPKVDYRIEIVIYHRCLSLYRHTRSRIYMPSHVQFINGTGGLTPLRSYLPFKDIEFCVDFERAVRKALEDDPLDRHFAIGKVLIQREIYGKGESNESDIL